MVLAPCRISIESLLRPCAIPRIAVAPLQRQFAHIVMNRLVAIAEDRKPSGHAVIARPDGSSACLRFKVAPPRSSPSAPPLLPQEGCGLQPSHSGVDSRDNR